MGSGDPKRIRKAVLSGEDEEVENVKGSHAKDDMKSRITESVIKFLTESPMIQSIKKVQMDNDPVGPLAQENMEDLHFLTAMTVRDCTIFLRVSVVMIACVVVADHNAD